mmetsp:Transcript_60330/g.69931  ORF Transcript_60330/g.69931 Transcript_60330/m.69931 type:complete len:92 (+) Transcript_60330:2-277(+)
MKAAIRTTGVAIEKDLDDTRFESGNLELNMRKLESRIARAENAILKFQDATEVQSAAMTEGRSSPSSVADKREIQSRMGKKDGRSVSDNKE